MMEMKAFASNKMVYFLAESLLRVSEITAYTFYLNCQSESLGTRNFQFPVLLLFLLLFKRYSAALPCHITYQQAILIVLLEPMGQILPRPLLSGRCLPPELGLSITIAPSASATCYYNQLHLFPVLSASVVAAGTSPTSSGSVFKGIRLESSPGKHFFILQNEEARFQLEVFISGVK